MNKLVIYWMLHVLGISGLIATLIATQYKFIPSYLLGAIGGCWLFGLIFLSRVVIHNSKDK